MMNRKQLALVAALFCLSPAVMAASAKAEKGTEKSAEKALDRKTVEARLEALPPAVREQLLARAQYAENLFYALVGEFALQRGQQEDALGAYLLLAKRSEDAGVMERACDLAVSLRQFALVPDLARKWVRIAPKSSRAWHMLIVSLAFSKQDDAVVQQIGEMLRQVPEPLAEQILGLNRLFAPIADKKKVLEWIEKAVAAYEVMPEAKYAQAQAALVAGDLDKALARSSGMMALAENWERGMHLRVQVLARRSQAAAIEELEQFLNRKPEARELRQTLARLYISAKQYSEARQQLGKVLEQAPDLPEALFPAAMLAMQQRDLDAGRGYLVRLLSSAYPDKSSISYFLGQIDEDKGKPDSALAYYQGVVAGEQYVPAKGRSAQILVQQGKPEAALELLRNAKGMNRDDKAQLALMETSLLRDNKRYQEAWDRLETVLKDVPDHVDLIYDQGMLAEKLGKPEVLEARMKRVLELKPDHAHALNALGYTLADQNRQLDEAHALITRALKLTPDDPFIMDSLGWVQFRKGAAAEALKTLRAAYALRADPEIAAHLGEVLWAQGEKEEAVKLWKAALTANPDNDLLKSVMKKFLP